MISSCVSKSHCGPTLRPSDRLVMVLPSCRPSHIPHPLSPGHHLNQSPSSDLNCWFEDAKYRLLRLKKIEKLFIVMFFSVKLYEKEIVGNLRHSALRLVCSVDLSDPWLSVQVMASVLTPAWRQFPDPAFWDSCCSETHPPTRWRQDHCCLTLPLTNLSAASTRILPPLPAQLTSFQLLLIL